MLTGPANPRDRLAATTTNLARPRSAGRRWLPESAPAGLTDPIQRTEQAHTITTSLIDYSGLRDADLCQHGAADDTDSPVSAGGCRYFPRPRDSRSRPVDRPTAVRSLIPVPRAPKE